MRCGDCTMFLVTTKCLAETPELSEEIKGLSLIWNFYNLTYRFPKSYILGKVILLDKKCYIYGFLWGQTLLFFFLIIGPSSAGQRRTQKPANNSANQRFFRLAGWKWITKWIFENPLGWTFFKYSNFARKSLKFYKIVVTLLNFHMKLLSNI